LAKTSPAAVSPAKAAGVKNMNAAIKKGKQHFKPNRLTSLNR
jgi:hypothetical protein